MSLDFARDERGGGFTRCVCAYLGVRGGNANGGARRASSAGESHHSPRSCRAQSRHRAQRVGYVPRLRSGRTAGLSHMAGVSLIYAYLESEERVKSCFGTQQTARPLRKPPDRPKCSVTPDSFRGPPSRKSTAWGFVERWMPEQVRHDDWPFAKIPQTAWTHDPNPKFPYAITLGRTGGGAP